MIRRSIVRLGHQSGRTRSRRGRRNRREGLRNAIHIDWPFVPLGIRRRPGHTLRPDGQNRWLPVYLSRGDVLRSGRGRIHHHATGHSGHMQGRDSWSFARGQFEWGPTAKRGALSHSTASPSSPKRRGVPILLVAPVSCRKPRPPPRDQTSLKVAPRAPSGGQSVPTHKQAGRQCGYGGYNRDKSPPLHAARAPIPSPHVPSSPVPLDEQAEASERHNSGRPERATGYPRWHTPAERPH